MSYVTGKTIKELREKRKLTQKELAENINVSDKTISKWETGKGLPDIGIMEELSKALGISIGELLAGEYRKNENRSGNMKKMKFYVCANHSRRVFYCFPCCFISFLLLIGIRLLLEFFYPVQCCFPRLSANRR